MSLPAPPTPLQIDYIDPDGFDWNLSDLSMENGYVCTGITGIEGLNSSLQSIPMLDGTAVASLYLPQPGTIVIGMLVGMPASQEENDYYSLLDRVARAFFHRRNEIPKPGYIHIQRPDGTSRQIAVYTTAGPNSPEVGLNDFSVFSFTLQTLDPYWQDLTPNQATFTVSSAGGILPLLPIALAGSAIGANITVINNGNSQSWPVWTITGPGTPTIKNVTSGRTWALNTSIPSGHVIQIVTKPGQQMAVDTTLSTNIWDQLVLGGTLSNLWSLMSGNNIINIAVAGATSSTSVGLQWTNSWARALWRFYQSMPGRELLSRHMVRSCHLPCTSLRSLALLILYGLRYLTRT